MPTIQGPVFDKSGQYNIQVSIVGTTNPKTMTTKDLLFETFLHLPDKQTFPIKTANAQEFSIDIKSYNDKILNFDYDESKEKISYGISYNWDEHKHNSSIVQLVFLEKTFQSFKQGYEIDIFAEGIKVEDTSFNFDILEPEKNIIRINIPHEELMSIKNKLDTNNDDDLISLEILSGKQIDYDNLDLMFENGLTAKVFWDSKLKTGDKIPLTFSFFDLDNNPAKNLMFAYSVSNSFGKEIWSNIGTSENYLGILTSNGIYQESVFIPNDGQYQLKIILTGENSKNFEIFLTSESDFDFGFC